MGRKPHTYEKFVLYRLQGYSYKEAREKSGYAREPSPTAYDLWHRARKMPENIDFQERIDEISNLIDEMFEKRDELREKARKMSKRIGQKYDQQQALYLRLLHERLSSIDEDYVVEDVEIDSDQFED